jgi:aminoglycoside phosphotransferase (APT) family kinase protein
MDRMSAIAERLGEVLAEAPPESVRRLSGGASRETFVFASVSRGEMVLQIDRHSRQASPPPPQAALLAAAAGAGVPVAAVVAHGGEDTVLGPSWIVLEGLPGTSDPRRILAGEQVPDGEALIDSIAAALAAVHRIPLDAGLAPAQPDPIADLRATCDRLGEPHPVFELAFRALGSEPPAGSRALVHSDFRMGNLMVDAGGVSGVLDWELTHVGDPVEDLGWLCVPAWRFERQDRPAAGLGTREELLTAYERHSGVAVDPEQLRWWELAGTLRWGVICVMQAFTHLSGGTRSIEHAVIGRRACEVEWDLLEMLDRDGALEEPATRPQAPTTAAPLHDRPTAIELLDAARATLAEDVLPLLEGRVAFELRVTTRALGMVRRELEHSAEHGALHSEALARLGVADEVALAEAIRAGGFDQRRAELLAALRAIVRAKLQVANPRYLERRPDAEQSRTAREGT